MSRKQSLSQNQLKVKLVNYNIRAKVNEPVLKIKKNIDTQYINRNI